MTTLPDAYGGIQFAAASEVYILNWFQASLAWIDSTQLVKTGHLHQLVLLA